LVAYYFFQYKIVHINNAVREILGLTGLLLILFAVFSFSKSTPFPGLYALIPTMGAALIIMFANSNTFVGALLSTKAFVGIGLISYSAYLWHHPLFVFARHASLLEPSAVIMSGLSFFTLAVSYFSWRFVEQPFRQRGLMGRKVIFSGALLAALAFCLVGLIGYAREGDVGRLAANERYASLIQRLGPNYGLGKDCEQNVLDAKDCRTSDAPEVLIWGDSFAMHLTPGFVASNRKNG
jgi:uncharacterized membrane protein (GlpM family)